MYQIVNPDGSKYDPVGVDVLKRWAQESRIHPDTALLDAVHGNTLRAGDLEELQGHFMPVPFTHQLPPAPQPMSGDGTVQIATVLGIVALCLAVIGWIPCLGWLQYLSIPLGLASLILSIVKTSQGGSGMYTTAIVTAAIALVIGVPRFFLGGCIGI